MLDALLNAMGTVRSRRIGRHEAERLLGAVPGERDGTERASAAQPDPSRESDKPGSDNGGLDRSVVDSAVPDQGSGHDGLVRLLAAAAAPGYHSELAGERDALAAFRRERNIAHPAAPTRKGFPINPPRYRPTRRWALLKATAGLALLMSGGAAVAAETGNLPQPVQRRAHELFAAFGVPEPDAPASATSPQPTGDPAPGRQPMPAPDDPRQARPSTPALAQLCRTWRRSQRDPETTPMLTEDLRALRAAAGGAERIPTYCASLPDPPPPSTAPNGPGQRDNGPDNRNPGGNAPGGNNGPGNNGPGNNGPGNNGPGNNDRKRAGAGNNDGRSPSRWPAASQPGRDGGGSNGPNRHDEPGP